MLAFVLVFGALAAAPIDAPIAAGLQPLDTVDRRAIDVDGFDLAGLIDDRDGGDDETAFAAARRAKRRPPVRRKPVATKPRPAERNPALIGLAGAGGAAIGAGIGLTGVAIAGVFATGVAGEQPVEVVIATAAIAIGIAVATPIMAGIGGGAGVLLADDRARPEEWQGLLGCATTGCCAGLGSAFSGATGGGCGAGGCNNVPGPDRPAEWTALAAVGGLAAGGVLGIVFGYIASDKTDIVVPMGIGGMGGALVGTAVAAGLAGGVAAAIRP